MPQSSFPAVAGKHDIAEASAERALDAGETHVGPGLPPVMVPLRKSTSDRNARGGSGGVPPPLAVGWGYSVFCDARGRFPEPGRA